MRLLPNNKDIGWTPYLWLVYAANLPLYAFLGNANARTWTLSLLSMAVFLALYFRGYWVKDRKLLAIIVALGLLGVVMAPVNPGASVYFVYASAFGGELGNTTKAVWVIACLMLAIVAVTLIFHLPGYFWISGLIFTAMVGAVDIHYAERRRENKKLLLAQEEVAQVAQIAERIIDDRARRFGHEAVAPIAGAPPVTELRALVTRIDSASADQGAVEHQDETGFAVSQVDVGDELLRVRKPVRMRNAGRVLCDPAVVSEYRNRLYVLVTRRAKRQPFGLEDGNTAFALY